jgi:hypothetical protein
MIPDDLRPDRPRVFGIGLNKTGTSSLDRAFTMLGLESLHWGGPPIRRLVESARDAGEPLLSRLDQRIDAFSDILALSESYALLDRQYPGSRFVLTVRDVEAWIDSRRRHVESNIRRREAGEYHGDFLVVDEHQWRLDWDQHVSGVRRYFEGRDDFLEVDITVDPRWGPLCGLLGRPEPREPFPWDNADMRSTPSHLP